MAMTLPCKRTSVVVEERGSESRELGSPTFAEGGWRSHKKQGVDVTLQVDVVMAIELHRRIGGCARTEREHVEFQVEAVIFMERIIQASCAAHTACRNGNPCCPVEATAIDAARGRGRASIWYGSISLNRSR